MSGGATRGAVLLTLVVTLAGSAVALAASASADTPMGWEESGAMSPVEALLVFAGVPLAITAVIVVLVMAPGAIRSGGRQMGSASWQEPHWFGGAPAVQQGAGDHPQIGTSEPSETTSRGGASAGW